MPRDRLPQSLFVWAAAALLALAVGYRLLRDGDPPGPEVAITADGGQPGRAASGGRAAPPRLHVHVAGAVRRPGLYRVRAGARVAAALRLAGGPRPRADLTTVNLAAPVEDGQQVVVPVRGAAPAVAAGAAAGGAAGAGPISLGSATQAQLEELDGIGPTLAERILAYRDEHGGFRSVAQLQEVDGIGEKRFEALRQAVRP